MSASYKQRRQSSKAAKHSIGAYLYLLFPGCPLDLNHLVPVGEFGKEGNAYHLHHIILIGDMVADVDPTGAIDNMSDLGNLPVDGMSNIVAAFEGRAVVLDQVYHHLFACLPACQVNHKIGH
jgi:hypothetical protein